VDGIGNFDTPRHTHQHTHTHTPTNTHLPTQSGPVLADQPAVVGEERRQADGEHGRREEQEHDVELGLRVREPILAGTQDGTATREHDTWPGQI